MTTRRRSNDGVGRRVFNGSPIRPSLVASVLKDEPKREIVKRPTELYVGPKPYSCRGKCVVSDGDVMVIRKLREWFGMSAGQIVRLTGHKESLVDAYVWWRSRATIDPGPRVAGITIEDVLKELTPKDPS